MAMRNGNSRFFKHSFVYEDFLKNLLPGLVDTIWHPGNSGR